MTSVAMGHGSLFCPYIELLPPPHVLFVRHWLKVIRIDAECIATEMVKIKLVWDDTIC